MEVKHCATSPTENGKKGEFSGLQLKAVTCSLKIAGFLSGLQEKFLFPWNSPRELQGEEKGKKQICILQPEKQIQSESFRNYPVEQE